MKSFTVLRSALSTLFLGVLLLGLQACGGGGGNGNGSSADITAPVITLNKNTSMTIALGDAYVEAGVTATDNVDSNVSVTITGNVDTGAVGEYLITYSSTDAAGNSSEVIRTVNVVTPQPFITTWKTDNPGSSLDNQIKIPKQLFSPAYDYTIDWGDGQTDVNVTSSVIHDYAVAGTYTITISGYFPSLYFDLSGTDAGKVLTVEEWGTNKWQSMKQMFAGCTNLIINAVDTPDLSQVTDMSNMFYQASSINQDLSEWDVSSVTNMSGMFIGALAFNQDLSVWDVSSVANMSGMFSKARAFNQELNPWKVSSVTNMSGMFSDARVFNHDLSRWDVSAVTNMSGMFGGKSSLAFNQSLNLWDVSAVTNMSDMFSAARVFNQDLSRWDVSAVTNMSDMFSSEGSHNFDQDLSSWDVSAVTDMSRMLLSLTLSTANYDALLSGWSGLILQNGVVFSGGNSKYSASAQTARDALVNTYGWTITDGGLAP